MKYSVALLSVLLLAGCGGGGRGGSEVAGTVSFTGAGPLPRGVVSINGPGGSYRAAIKSDGTYVISDVPDGTYTVAITGVFDGPPVEGDQMEYDADGNFIESEVVEPKSLIDPMYSTFDQSGMTLKVPGEYDLQVPKAE
ncbi:MAG: carboxypeptidase-like regulatory domain-containing protein [Planctomycetota bacterium]|nr:carboxypeptidase-like regulatory domain-containing protein [Planctomycetota bacterium]MDA0918609.1 carboxypeptidase-like regulatory domain-containing protein [Planctomycetota bacterium]